MRAVELILAANAALDAGRLDAAERLARQALDADPRHPDALHVSAKVGYRRRDLRTAEQLLRRAIGADAAVPEFHSDLANILQDRGDLDGAIAAYRRALRLKPDAAEAHNDLGTAYGEKGEFAAAIRCYETAIRLQPEHLVAHGNLGAAYRRLGQVSAARRALQRELVLRLKRALQSFMRKPAATLCAQGEDLLRRGNLRFAEEVARRALDDEPASVPALRLLGAILERQRRASDAIAALREAVRLAPADAALHRQLGRLLAVAGESEQAMASLRESRRLEPGSAATLAGLAELELKRGRPSEAEALAREGLSRKPRNPDLRCLLGDALARKKAFAEAEAEYRRALEIDPDHIAAWIRSSEVLRETGRLDDAEACAARALELDAESPAAVFVTGMALKAKGRSKAAIEHFERAIALDPQQLQAHQQLARSLREEDDVKGAERWLRAALAHRPEEPSLLADLALVLGDQMRYEEAFAKIQRALERAPESVAALTCKGMLLDQVGRQQEALACLHAARSLAPQDDNTHFSIALHHLKHGDFGAGWDGYERRRRLINFIGRYRDFPFPEWDGAPLAGRTLLLYPEQGLGDEIMFGGCIPEVAAQARHVVIECDRKLEQIFRRSFPGCRVVPRHRSVANDWVRSLEPQPDVQSPLGSLPRHFRRRPEDFPRHQGYLRADPAKVQAWRERLAGLGPGRSVGLSWKGGVGYTGRVRRSLSLEQLLPLLRRSDVHFISLQYTDVREEIAELTRRHGLRVHHWQEAIDDYDETAALVCALDEVLTVCTAIVHLSGALGRPATVMVPYSADWRYGAQGERMPWYPSVRLLRQPAIGDWNPVLEEAARRLAGTAVPG